MNLGTHDHLKTTGEGKELDSSNGREPDSGDVLAKRRRVIIGVSLLVLLIGLGMINWLVPASVPNTQEGSGNLGTPAQAGQLGPGTPTAPAAITPPLLGLATPWGVIGRDSQPTAIPPLTSQATTPVTPSPAVTVDLPAEAMIQLLGPPTESSFQLNDPISFYWNWPFTLGPDQRFAVYLRAGSDEWLLGTVEHNNLGSAFRLRAELMELVSQAAQYEWLVRLELLAERGGDRPQVLRESETRPLLLLDN